MGHLYDGRTPRRKPSTISVMLQWVLGLWFWLVSVVILIAIFSVLLTQPPG